MASPTSETPALRRRHPQGSDARRAILDATEALLVEGGDASFSIRRLSQRCGYSAPTIYHHFGDKLGLIDALLEERMRRLLARLRRVRRGPDPLENVRALAAAFARFGVQNPRHYQLLTAPRPESSPPSRTGEEIRALFEEPLIELYRASRLRDVGVEEVKQCLWVLMHGVISMKTGRPDEGWSRSLLETALDALLRGLVTPEPRVDARVGAAS